METLTKEEAIASFEILKPEVILIELDKAPETVGKSAIIVRPDTNKFRQENTAESGKIVKMYRPEEGEEVEESMFKKFKVGDRITFMDYVAPRGPFQKHPELRVMSLNEIMAKLTTDKSIMD